MADSTFLVQCGVIFALYGASTHFQANAGKVEYATSRQEVVSSTVDLQGHPKSQPAPVDIVSVHQLHDPFCVQEDLQLRFFPLVLRYCNKTGVPCQKGTCASYDWKFSQKYRGPDKYWATVEGTKFEYIATVFVRA